MRLRRTVAVPLILLAHLASFACVAAPATPVPPAARACFGPDCPPPKDRPPAPVVFHATMGEGRLNDVRMYGGTIDLGSGSVLTITVDETSRTSVELAANGNRSETREWNEGPAKRWRQQRFKSGVLESETDRTTIGTEETERIVWDGDRDGRWDEGVELRKTLPFGSSTTRKLKVSYDAAGVPAFSVADDPATP